ncbi:unnamed protein product [Ilex paraguariensis]|uniref:RWP-RK domain-containing protein n=1 Tax=Ilex paraguariensis TaxID=185542 RepID=A0ABC8S454_9AQUA
MDSTQLSFLKVETQNEFDWFYYLEEPSLGLIEQHSAFCDSFDNYMTSLFDVNPCLLPPQNNHHLHFGFDDFEDISQDFGFWDPNFPSFYEDTVINAKPFNYLPQHFDQSDHKVISFSTDFPAAIHHQRELANARAKAKITRESVKSKSAALELEEIQKYFDVPITKAAKELKVGLTVLKKRCRELNIMRWPHRKIKSLKSLIDNVKELGFTNEVGMLEEHKRMVEKVPELELTERTKRLRQACFKANYKKRRSLAAFA